MHNNRLNDQLLNLILEDGNSNCKEIINLETTLQRPGSLIPYKSKVLLNDIINRLNLLSKQIITVKDRIETRLETDMYYEEKASGNIPPPPELECTESDDESKNEELFNDYQNEITIWEEEIQVDIVNLKDNDKDIILRLNYYKTIIDNYLLDLSLEKKSKSTEIFGTSLSNIHDIKPNMYLWKKRSSDDGDDDGDDDDDDGDEEQSHNKLVYIYYVDYVNSIIWFQPLETTDSKGITNLKRQWFSNHTTMLKSASFDDFIPILPNIFYSRKKNINPNLVNDWLFDLFPNKTPNLKDKRQYMPNIDNILGRNINVSTGFYKKYIIKNIELESFSYDQYKDICFEITQIKKFLDNPNLNNMLVKSTYIIDEFHGILYDDDDVKYYNDIIYYDQQLDRKYEEYFEWEDNI